MAPEGDDPSGRPWRRPLRRYWRSLELRLRRPPREGSDGPAADPAAGAQDPESGPPRPGAVEPRAQAVENSLREIDRQIEQLNWNGADPLRVTQLLREVQEALNRLRQEQRAIVEDIDRLLGRL